MLARRLTTRGPDVGERSDKPRVLVVEDEESIRDLVCFHLDLAGYVYETATDGKEALTIATSEPFDVVVLDVVLPNLDGMTLCQAIRREGPNREVPILMLTARREESDKVLGLESGADDYLTKPFSFREFLARISALLRRPRSTWRPSPRDDRAHRLAPRDRHRLGTTSRNLQQFGCLADTAGIRSAAPPDFKPGSRVQPR